MIDFSIEKVRRADASGSQQKSSTKVLLFCWLMEERRDRKERSLAWF